MQTQTLKQWMSEHTPAQREQLAQACGTSVPYLYQLAGGHRVPSLRLALDISLHTQGLVVPESFLPSPQAA